MTARKISTGSILEFLSFLKERNLFYTIDQRRGDSIMISVTSVGHRIEIDIRDDGVEYSVFKGSEEVLDNEDGLFELLKSLSS